MKKQDVRDALYAGLGAYLPGWKVVKKDEAFVRPITGGVQKIFVAIVDYNPEFRLSLTFATRIERSETIVNGALGVSPADGKVTVTSMTQLDYFFPDQPKPMQLSVRSDEDVRKAIDTMGSILRDKALPFLDAHQDVAALDRAMNGGDPAFDVSDPTNRAMHALTVARLAGNPRFEELATSYQAAIQHFPEMSKQQLARVIEHLRGLQT